MGSEVSFPRFWGVLCIAKCFRFFRFGDQNSEVPFSGYRDSRNFSGYWELARSEFDNLLAKFSNSDLASS